MEYGNLPISILNLFGFMGLGFLWAYVINKEWQKLNYISAKKITIIAVIAGAIGGLVGIFINGMPDGISINNITFASVFSVVSAIYYKVSQGRKIKI